jgi:hypothetical protein
VKNIDPEKWLRDEDFVVRIIERHIETGRSISRMPVSLLPEDMVLDQGRISSCFMIWQGCLVERLPDQGCS